MKTFRDAEARLAETLPGYESRPQQQALAEAVEKAIENGRHLVGEAGCGTGKSLGYLIPAVLAGKRVVVSTATKALQDQVANKDVPFLEENLGVAFTSAVLKGRSNYLCLNKALVADPGNVPHLAEFSRLGREAAEKGEVLDRESFTFEIDWREWAEVAADSEDCQALGCKEDGICFAQAARKKAADADVVIVNHALYFTDLMVKNVSGGAANILGEHEVVIFDEAHECEEYAAGTLGSQFTENGMRQLVTRVRNFAQKIDHETAEAATEAGAEVLGAATLLWEKLKPGRIRQATLVECEDEWVGLGVALRTFATATAAISLEGVATGNIEDAKKQKNQLVRRTIKMAMSFADVVVADFAELVRWVESEKKGREERMVIKTSPIHVGPILRDWLFAPEEGGPTAILVSATMLVDGKADYLAGRLGLDAYDEIDVGTPFDYEAQSALYVPAHLPEPTPANRSQWAALSIQEMYELVQASDGRALLLFTSRSQMTDAYSLLAPRLPYTCLMQGQESNKILAERFMEDTHSVLFAVRSFFTGVDFQGEACSLVVMDKLPFPVPTEPITEARCEAIAAAGGNEFMDYTVPVMSLILKQGFGRLIRHREDRGVVAILDPRLLTKRYGKTILRSLPPARRITEQAEVKGAFA